MEDIKAMASNENEVATVSILQDDPNVVTMLDVLEDERAIEEEYAAVLGASDEKECTFVKGSVKRQALYSCLTCCPEALNDLEKCAGICLACSYRCHENHELIELYTKRNFRCDCPTVRFKDGRCMLNATLDAQQPSNKANLYNHNFQGLYCNCGRPYPDPQRTTEEVMLQCGICEDWFHLHHLDAPPEAAKLIDVCCEMICNSCMSRHSFLHDYTGLALNSIDKADESEANSTVGGQTEKDIDKIRSELDESIAEFKKIEEDDAEDKHDNKTGDPAEAIEPERKRQKLENGEATTEAAEESRKCQRPIVQADNNKGGATFWGSDWRAALCRCTNCVQMYKQQGVEFLLDSEDSSKSYEERGMRRAAGENSTYEEGIRALASIGRVQQIDAITEYNRMTEKLKGYLQTFAATKKIVTEDDINRFFAEMRSEKKTFVGQPHFCR